MVYASLLDTAGEMRAGEELDAGSLQKYLHAYFGGDVKNLAIKQYRGGYSNLTYQVTIGDQMWVLRRPPFGSKVKSAHDMSREYRMLSALQGVFEYAPQPIIYCDDRSVIGCEFYLMS